MSAKRLIIPIGTVYNNLTVIKEADAVKSAKIMQRRFLCKCACGNESIVWLKSLRSGTTKSCGCARIEHCKKAKHTAHGYSSHFLYPTHNSIMQRCYNTKCKAYKRYGERGITVCKSWHNIEKFIVWALENGYEPHLEIDRKDNNKGYKPSNCKWTTSRVNNNNRNNNYIIKVKGKKYTLANAVRKFSERTYNAVWKQLKTGKTVERALGI